MAVVDATSHGQGARPASALTPEAPMEQIAPSAATVPEFVQHHTMVSRFWPPRIDDSCVTAILECAICLEPFEAGQAVRTLPCMHRFHAQCVDAWLALEPICPFCRHPLAARWSLAFH